MNEIKKKEIALEDESIIDFSKEIKDGQTKCHKCGATDISLNESNGKLRCHFCRYEFEPQTLESTEDLTQLKGKVIGKGAKNLISDTQEMMTLKCESCGSEVVIDTQMQFQARCHWCRHTLSINHQIPNGSIPDVVLPFSIKKEAAKEEIEKFVGARKFFAHPAFVKEFTSDNVMGVYLPYMLVDINGSAKLTGEGEHLVRKYQVGSDKNKSYRYDADCYSIERTFDLTIKELSIESSQDKLDKHNKDKTTNIINSIMPFDTQNCVKWDANYLRGYTSEKRDIDISALEPRVIAQSRDIATFQANQTSTYYDRGIRWEQKNLEVKGQQWKAAYLPIWLYSYQQKKNNQSLLHYVAVNGRTKETMGSVPIHMAKLWLFTILIEFISIFFMFFVDFDEYSHLKWGLLLPGVIFFTAIYMKYRNFGARHSYEAETVVSVDNLVQNDTFIKHEKGLSNSRIRGENQNKLEGEDSGWLLDSVNNIKLDKLVVDHLSKKKF